MSKESCANAKIADLPLKKRGPKGENVISKRHEIIAIITGIGALFMLLSLVSYQNTGSVTHAATENLMGMAGQWTAHVLFTLIGLTAYLFNAFTWVTAGWLFVPRPKSVRAKSILGLLIIALLGSALIHTALAGDLVNGHPAGGFIGELMGELSISIFATAGTYLVLIGIIVVTLLLITDISLFLVAQGVAAVGVTASKQGFIVARKVLSVWKIDPEEDVEDTPPPSPTPSSEKKGNTPNKKSETDADKKDRPDTKQKDKPTENDDAKGPVIVKTQPKKPKKPKKKEPEDLVIQDGPLRGTFYLPSLELISGAPDDANSSDIDEAHLTEQAEKLVKVLADFNVFGEVKEIHPGPVVTMFEFQPKSGTKLSKIEGLASELAMVLEVIRVRVVAPIPGKHAVGFELPNKKRETVYLKDMLLDDSFNNPKFKLPLALGRDIAGDPVSVDLAKMPHLLIAGTTGSGKSVSVNAMLLSLLYKYTPEDLRLLLVDPKMIELGIYDHIPHLLLPVVTDMSKACLALKWAVDEMERRYQLFADLGVRNLASYNKKVASLKAEHAKRTDEEKTALIANDAIGIEDEEVVVVSSTAAHPEKLEKLPFIVTVVDELADLMMVAAKDVETSIARLAQKARASGIHLIIATQRPSVDVITGLIKANFPSRISFRVSSGTDSRTILGTIGAENLLGMGDMLILPPGTSDLTRVHGAFVEDDEIHQVVKFLKEQGKPQYDEEILKPRDDEENDVDDTEKDEVYDQAVAIVAEAQTCSISMLQRRLRIGYNRSARIVEIMEKEGVVGPANGVNKREVLISPQ